MIRPSQFLGAFREYDERIHLRAFKPKTAPDTPENAPQKWTTTLVDLTENRSLQQGLRTKNQHCGIYFVVNAGGDTDAEIKRFTAFYVENDSRSIEEQHQALDAGPLQPSIRVVTRKSVHAYFLIAGKCSEVEWRDGQSRLIAFYDGDPKIKNPARVMRVPGFDHVHLNGNGLEHQKVTVHTFEPDSRYTVTEILDAFPLAESKNDLQRPQSHADGFQYHEDRNAELAQRVMSRGKRNSKGNWDARGNCHNGTGGKGLVYFPSSGAVKCNADPPCDYFSILRAEGLPDGHLPSRNSLKVVQGGQSGPREIEASDYQTPWPTLEPKAIYGLAGDIAGTIEPHSEADPVALIIQVFAAYGNVIGRTAYFSAEADRHYTNLYVVLVGRTSKGRKGTSWSHVRKLFKRVDENWSANCVYNGLSSGEGVIHHLRDKSEKKEPVKEKGKVVSYQTVIVDHGVDDKRAFIIETEFGSVIVVMSRQGVTLSAILRQGWDGVTLRVMSRNTAAIATGALISIVGHITSDELTRNLDQTERANGFANRFLWPLVRRSKFLPEGGSPSDSELNPLIERLNEAIKFGRSVREMKRDEQAASLWREVYPQLSEGHKGMLGVVTSRAEAQTMRLACLYALLDLSPVIRRVHLEAALALWQYCEDSAKYIFGDSLGDRLADEILSALREASETGLTRSQISALFARNKDADKIGGALKCLAENGLAHTQKEQGPNGGRPIERWFASVQVATARPSDAVFEDFEIEIPTEAAYA